MNTVKISVKSYAKVKDPVFSRRDHYFMYIKSSDMPKNLPRDPDPRAQDTTKSIYKDITESFLDKEHNTFHLKNQGIDIIAKEVKIHDGICEITFGKKDGILNGLHTYDIIMKNKDKNPDQYVLLKITTHIPESLIADVASGLNTCIQVSRESLLNKKGEFNWIKKKLIGYRKSISYIQNNNSNLDVQKIVQILTVFNIGIYPNGEDKYPTMVYSTRDECLEKYERYHDSYIKFAPILKDILKLHDTIIMTAAGFYGEEYKSSKLFRKIKHKLIFINRDSDYKLVGGVLLPVLGAFRCLITQNDATQNYEWIKNMQIDDILKIWNESGHKIMEKTRRMYKRLGEDPNKLGKSQEYWKELYQYIKAMYY